jgi:predicted CXXCH cytochrome family protein
MPGGGYPISHYYPGLYLTCIPDPFKEHLQAYQIPASFFISYGVMNSTFFSLPKWRSILTFLTVCTINTPTVHAEADTVPGNTSLNQECLACHGHKQYFYFNEMAGKTVKERMNPYYVIDSADFYYSNHRSFRCTDCHSTEYSVFPHSGELRMEPRYVCMDCHEGDENTAQYKFEAIQEEFLKSVHSTRHSEEFTCWMCHNPHSYRINVRTSGNLKETIRYDNEICLSCHADIDKFQLLTERDNPNISEVHSWLPNQVRHFSSVRCIECHTEVQDNLLVAHNIKEKKNAVRRCAECHSQNSRLMASLYKYQVREERNTMGFFNASILKHAYIIGANRNYYLNLISWIVLGSVFGGIFIHAFLRIFKK